MLVAAVLWGTTGTARALGPDDASPAAVGALRIIVGGTLLVLVFVTLPRFVAPASRQARRQGDKTRGGWAVVPTVTAAVAMAAYQPLFFGGVVRTGVAVGTVVGIGSAPVFAGLLGTVVRGERLGRRWLLATVLALGGTVLLLGTGDRADVDPRGIALALGAGASYAVYTLATKLLLDRGLESERVVAVTFGLAALLLVPVAAAAGIAPLVSVRGIAVVAHLAGLTVAVAYVLFARGLATVDVGVAGTLTLAEPATAATLGFVVLGERPGAGTWAGLLLIAAGLAMLVSMRAVPVRRTGDAGTRSRPT
ncbi:MAG: DMT family transporter [Acidimicrobiales bacterium]